MSARIHPLKRYLWRARSVINLMRYGSAAPQYAELIWVRPRDVKGAVVGRSDMFSCSGKVVHDEIRAIDLYDTPRIRSCRQRWVDGIPWDQTPEYMPMREAILSGKDWAGCSTEDGLRARYAELDDLFHATRISGRLKTRQELDSTSFREEGGILICIGSNGEPLFFEGAHRFGIALVLDLPIIPAQLGCVHVNAIGCLQRYREGPAMQKQSVGNR
jgi:hypothetical protein